ncbi:MAG: hypothetical protein JXB49_06100 [Bacteroidales bacterium]|nr:hypothetical protein [Bacteroidales bacterium]
MKNNYYYVHGLTISSDIVLPELVVIEEQEPDVLIRSDKVPNHLPSIKGAGVLYEAAQDDFLFKLDKVAKYRVQEGKYITVEATETATSEEVRLFLLGSTMGALLHQRSMLAIHASSVNKDNKGLLIAGVSSSGKSSLAAGLLEKGYSIISDDVSVIGFEKEDGHYIFPGIPHLKLWKDVLLHLNESLDLEKVRPKLEKYKKSVCLKGRLDPIGLDKIIILSTKNTPGYHFEEVFGSEKFILLRQNTYRIQFISKLNKTKSYFENLTKLAALTRVFRVERPSSPIQIRDLATFVEDNIINI